MALIGSKSSKKGKAKMKAKDNEYHVITLQVDNEEVIYGMKAIQEDEVITAREAANYIIEKLGLTPEAITGIRKAYTFNMKGN